MIILKPVTTEKAVMLMERTNTFIIETSRAVRKEEIKKTIEMMFNVKIKGIHTHIRNNKKYAYVKLNKEYPAMDFATKLGII
jgi:ribosomal protein L23